MDVLEDGHEAQQPAPYHRGAEQTGDAMQATATRLTGVGAGAKKYDVLSVLALAGLENAALPSQRALRFIALITIRYNWAADMLSVGHEELGHLWKVSKRTVIREMEALRSLGLLVVLRPGRRGTVTTYRLDISAIRKLAASRLLSETSGIDSRLAASEDNLDNEPSEASQASIRNDPGLPPSPCRDLWTAVLDNLSPSVSSAQKDRWLGPLRAELVDDIFYLEADSAFRAVYIAKTFSDALHVAARPLGVRRISIKVAGSTARGLDQRGCGV
jgi:hypothetical protein